MLAADSGRRILVVVKLSVGSGRGGVFQPDSSKCFGYIEAVSRDACVCVSGSRCFCGRGSNFAAEICGRPSASCVVGRDCRRDLFSAASMAKAIWRIMSAHAPSCQPHTIHRMLLGMNHQNPCCRRRFDREAISHAATALASLPGQCSRSRKSMRSASVRGLVRATKASGEAREEFRKC